MDPKNQENYLKKYDEKSLDKLQSKLVFNDPAYLFIFKKTEKIVAALYLITNLLSDSEPVKLQIRQASLKLLSDTLSFKKILQIQSKTIATDLIANTSEIISLLKVASLSGQVSAMNHGIMHKELLGLLSNIDSLNLDSFVAGGVFLPQDFFNVPEPSTSPVAQSFQTIFPKGQYKTPIPVKDSTSTSTPEIKKDNVKDGRRETIIRLLKAGKPLGIKDFVTEIKGCSEKTIQRELIDMVEKGVLKKTGERRWSVYSLI